MKEGSLVLFDDELNREEIQWCLKNVGDYPRYKQIYTVSEYNPRLGYMRHEFAPSSAFPTGIKLLEMPNKLCDCYFDASLFIHLQDSGEVNINQVLEFQFINPKK